MVQDIRKISFNIYSSTDEEAEKGRMAFVRFINLMGQHGAKVSGEKISEAVTMLESSPFIMTQIINFFKQQ